MKKTSSYKRAIFLGIIMISLGITLSTISTNSLKNAGIVFIAIGGFFFIVGMNRKKNETKKNES